MSYKINKDNAVLFLEDPITIDDVLVVKPRSNVKTKIDVNITKINITNKEFVDNVIKRKLRLQLEKVINATLMVLDDEDDDPTNIVLALDEAAKFQAMLRYKYQQFLTPEFEAAQNNKLKDVIKELKRQRNFKKITDQTTKKTR